MSLYIIRHGQTDFNAQARFQGSMDIPLNDIGRGQALRNGKKLNEILRGNSSKFDFVCSPLGRARETMEIIRSELELPKADYRIDKRLTEINFGDWEGHTAYELEQKFPELYAQREANKWTFTPPGERAESYASLAERITPVFEEFQKPTICVCHGGVIRVMLQIKGEVFGHNAAITQIPQDEFLSIKGTNAEWI
ncbi:histidine phosphatase family protein [Lentilitoribacter sp. Alg239-R112]|uniref:histidine phosphatase family protein n=1 Tax=Lentilitoribacter sp. Alg239-R112 TaxID=2305987 RepID=UPI0013A6B2E3|nr:histidine phosphatase family protein [Lentilitoribacter sp. Alg239-R112]